MNKRRLLKLAELLDADAKNKNGVKFDYYSWGWISNKADPVSCGTSACAFGLAAISGAFKRAGLTYSLKPEGRLRFQLGGRAAKPIYAAQKIFDISETQAIHLFAPGLRDPTTGAGAERFVARKIRKFIKAIESSR